MNHDYVLARGHLVKMVDAAAVIRPYEARDKKLVRFMVGKSNMEALGVANNRAYFHPVTLAVWFALSAAFIHIMNWWPTNEFGFWSCIKPLPGFATMALPILAYIDWNNRPEFEELTQEVARYQDLQSIPRYYQDPASGLFIFEMGDTYIGFIAIDANQPTERDPRAPKTALIRHFHVDEKFRKTNAQKDLLDYAVSHAFKNNPELQRVQATYSPLLTYQRSCLHAYGFKLDHHTKTVGLQKWRMGVCYLQKEQKD